MRRALALALAVLGTLAVPAAADDLKIAPAQETRFPQRAWVLSLPEGRALDASSLTVTENGRAVDRLRVVPGGEAGPRTFGTVLVVDASRSMSGEPISAAMEAARAFAARRQPGQQLGIVFFNKEVTVAEPLTTDAGAIESALAELPDLHTGTRLNDGVIEGVGMLRDAKVSAGSLVVLSDGADVGSDATAAQAAESATGARVRAFTVGLRSGAYDSAALAELADATGGVLAEAAGPSGLTAVFDQLGRRLANEYIVRYRSLAPLGSDVEVVAEVPGFGAPARATYSAPKLDPAPVAPAASPGFWSSTGALAVTATLIALLLALALALVVRPRRAGVRERVGAFVAPRTAGRQVVLEHHHDPGSVERALSHTRLWARYEDAVELAGYRVSPIRLAVYCVAGTVVGFWFVGSVLDRPGAAVLLLLSPLVGTVVIRSRIAKRRREFAEQLADNLQVVASAMRTGQSFVGGLVVALEDAAEPARSELARVVSDEQLGVPLEQAMETAARRMDSRELEHVAVVATLQRETGGNTAEILDRLVETIRHRDEVRRLVRTLTAQGRLGGGIVSALPVVLIFALELLNPQYLDPLFEEPAGQFMIVVAAGLIGLGWVAIRKIVDIKT